jgi:hypothetical protein
MISRVASRTLCPSRVVNSRVQREVAVCEVAPDSDRLSGSLASALPPPFDPTAASRLDSWSQERDFDDPSADLSFAV